MTTYGKIRRSDLRVVRTVVLVFKKFGLHSGLHGTSIWNSRYQDIDLLVVSISPKVGLRNFFRAIDEIQRSHGGEIVATRGNNVAGLDYDINIKRTFLHISYVVLL